MHCRCHLCATSRPLRCRAICEQAAARRAHKHSSMLVYSCKQPIKKSDEMSVQSVLRQGHQQPHIQECNTSCASGCIRGALRPWPPPGHRQPHPQSRCHHPQRPRRPVFGFQGQGWQSSNCRAQGSSLRHTLVFQPANGSDWMLQQTNQASACAPFTSSSGSMLSSSGPSAAALPMRFMMSCVIRRAQGSSCSKRAAQWWAHHTCSMHQHSRSSAFCPAPQTPTASECHPPAVINC